MRVKLVPRNDRADTPTTDAAAGAGWAGRWRSRSAPGSDTNDPRRRNRARAFGVLALALIVARIAAVPITLSQDEVYGAHAVDG